MHNIDDYRCEHGNRNEVPCPECDNKAHEDEEEKAALIKSFDLWNIDQEWYKPDPNCPVCEGTGKAKSNGLICMKC